ncbi:transmembrane protein 223 [Venturia canescens]|uniref:transmembrane protein 223 n=1 Tax=Venturia canescens TaxID=32260 RepID=UPI001C9BF97A|nr:transmembrane protein 223 [Venturia canescens]
MYSSIMRLNHGSLKQGLKILSTTRCCYSQTIQLPKSILTRVLCNPRNVLCLEASKKYFSILSPFKSNVCIRKEKIIDKNKLHNLALKEGSRTSSLDLNTTVSNNVLLYKYERPKLFTFLNWFSPFQCVFWVWISYYLYTISPERTNSLFEYFKQYWGWVIACGLAAFLGTTSTVLIWAFTSRSIKYIILKPGGQTVTILTYRPWKGNIGITFPLSDITPKMSRKEMINYMPIKVKGRRLFYIIDSGGEFVNPKLYDFTIGLKRYGSKRLGVDK